MRRRYDAVNVFPVNLLVGDRLFLVVGGGRVALRKTKLLLDAGARVRVVSPEVHEDLRVLAESGRIELLGREFQQSDVEGVFLAFAATDDADVNREVLEACREAGALCCPVDANWPRGDFLTPATVRRSGLIVSISTGGRSCRRSSLVKRSIGDFIDGVSSADLLVVGTSHQQLALEEREPLHLTGERFDRTGRMLSQIRGVHEFALLNTCNRVELIAAVAADEEAEPLIERILGFDALREGEFYRHRGFDAFRHLAMVTSGLLSQSPGEDHIVAQVKEALDLSERHGWADGIMRGWLGCALHLSKDIRDATAPMLEAGEIEDVCMRYLGAEGVEGHDANAVVIGTGTVGRGVVERLVPAGFRCTWCYHRNVPDLPDSWDRNVTVASLEDLESVLPGARVVFTAVDSPRHVLAAEHAEPLSQEGGAIVFDLGIPRNIAPELAEASEGARVIDLDDLKEFHQRTCVDLAAVFEQACCIVEEHGDMYDGIIESLQGRHEGQ